MLVAVLNQPQLNILLDLINLNYIKTDCFELRLDYLLPSLAIENITTVCQVIKNHNKKIIFTLRSINDHGLYNLDEHSRLVLLNKLVALNYQLIDYVDLEHYIDLSFIKLFKKNYPQIKIIRSYHNFNKNNDNFNLFYITNIFENLILEPSEPSEPSESSEFQDLSEHLIDSYKLIFYAKSSLDNFVILKFLDNFKKNKLYKKYKITAHCMGELGQASRILGKKYGNQFTYCVLTEWDKLPEVCISSESKIDIQISRLTPAPGSISLDDLINIYNYNNINHHTKIFALIGNPIEHSVGHIFHNQYYKKNNINAIYIKLLIQESELEDFFSWFKQPCFSDFYGLSVTMPYKYTVTKYLDDFNNLSPINTVKKINNKLSGINTDGIGVVQALLQDQSAENFKNKKILILGAGGAAAGIIAELSKNQYGVAKIDMVNRTYSNALKFAQIDKCNIFSFDDFDSFNNKKQYDYIINTIDYLAYQNNPENNSADLIKKINNILNIYATTETIYMNINYNDKQENKLNNACYQTVSGYQMYVKQAEGQIRYWVSEH